MGEVISLLSSIQRANGFKKIRTLFFSLLILGAFYNLVPIKNIWTYLKRSQSEKISIVKIKRHPAKKEIYLVPSNAVYYPLGKEHPMLMLTHGGPLSKIDTRGIEVKTGQKYGTLIEVSAPELKRNSKIEQYHYRSRSN